MLYQCSIANIMVHVRALIADDYDAAGTMTPAAYLRVAQQWREQGASIIGGCCGVGPAHIQLIASQLK